MSIFSRLLSITSKTAGIEQPDQQQMEQEFAQMAFQFVADRAPALTPYGIGFEIVEREDDGSRVCGVFGYKIGAEFYMIPVFFLNGQIKGINSIYSKSTNTFSPLTDSVIDKIISRSSVELGNGVSRSQLQPELRMPDLSSFRYGGGKYASVLGQMWKQASVSVLDMLQNDSAFQECVAGALAKAAGEDPIPADPGDLVSYIKSAGPGTAAAMAEAMCGNSKLASAVVDFYGSVNPVLVREFDPKCMEWSKAAAASPKVEIVFSRSSGNSGTCAGCPDISDTDKKRMVRDGFRIVDRREKAEKSELYDVEYPLSFTAPDKSGRYDVLLRSGVTTEAWVLTPFSTDQRGLRACIETDKHCLAMYPQKKIFVRGSAQGASAYDSAKPVDSMTIGGRYVIVDAGGRFLGPFVVTSFLSEDGERTRVKVDWQWFGRSFDEDTDSCLCSNESSCASSTRFIELVPGRSGDPCVRRNTVVVPEAGMRALELNYPVAPGEYGHPYLDSEKESFELGCPDDINNALAMEGFKKIAVINDPSLNGTCRIQADGVLSHPVTYKRAFLTLVGNYGFSVDDADACVTEMDVRGRSQKLVNVKLAQDSSGVAMPWFQIPDIQGADPYSGSMIQTPQSVAVPGYDPSRLPPQQPFAPGMANSGGVPAPDQAAMDLALQAAQAGQRTVFDHAGIKSLSKLYDVNTVIDSYIPKMMTALDSLGRLLFLLQWKSEDFVERFGADSLPDIEDILVSVYKGFGDLVMTLREKSINTDDAGASM